ncbi:tape measure domain-containing protein [Acinetobacter sp. ANC 4216]|nr:tape measure domain-containing protein [Acinetobacter sp. ANC 4216]
MDADTKSFVTNVNQSKQAAEKAIAAIKDGSASIVGVSDQAAKAIDGIIPKNANERAIKLTESLNAITESLKSTDFAADGAIDGFKKLGVDSVRSLNILKANLATSKTKLEEFSKTNATPEDIRNAQQQVDALEKEVLQADKAFIAFKSELSLINPEVAKLDAELGKANAELQQTESFTQRASGEIQGLKTGFTALTSALAALGIGTSAMEIAQTADEYKNLSGRISIAVGEHGNLQKAMDDVKNVAIATNSNLTATGDLYARLTKIGQEMKWPQEQALALTETINKAIQVGGGSAASNEAAITQLNQALGSGVLRGDEFNSMVEQSPRLTQAMADGIGVTIGKLREMAEAGQLTTDVVTKALLSQSEKISTEFAKFPTTIGASIENLKTAWTVYIGEADAASGVSARVAEAIKLVADNLDVLVSAFISAAQAFVAYKAIGMAATFLEKANAIRGAQLAIATETTSVVTNTQAQIANAGASRAAALAKTQLAAATNASNTANIAASGVFGKVSSAASGLKGSIAAVLSRFGAYGIAAAGLVIASDLIIDGLKKTDEWLLRQGSDFIDWAVSRITGTKSLVEQEKEWVAAEEESRKKQEEAAAVKEKNAARTEMLKNASLGLNEVSKATVLEFDKQVKAGEKVSETLDGIAKSFNFDSTTGINNGITALLALQAQGKASGDEIRKALTGILKDEDLVAFQGRLAAIPINIEKQIEATNAKIKAKQAELDAWKKANQDANWNDWKAATDKYRADIEKLQAESSALQVQYANSVKGAAMVQGAILDEAIRRTGLSYEELSGKSTKAFISAKNDVNVLVSNLDNLKEKGVDVGRALDASISNAISTATNQKEVDDLKAKINSLRNVLGEKVADGLLRQAEQQLIDIKDKADQAKAGINSVQEAFNLFGMKTPSQLKVIAEQYKAAFDEMKKSGQATLSQQQEAFKQYAEKAIAANKGVADSTLLSQANMLDLKIEVDATGKASIKSMSDLEASINRTGDSFKNIENGARSAGNVMREEAESAGDAWRAAVEKANQDFKAEMKAQGEALSSMYDYQSYSKADVLSQLKSKGYSDKEAQKLAGDIWAQGMAADRDAKYSSLGRSGPLTALINAEFDKAASKGLTTQNGTNKINELLRSINMASTGSSNLNDYVPSIPSVSNAASNINSSPTTIIRFESNGQQVEAQVDANQVDPLVAMLEKLKVIKKSS